MIYVSPFMKKHILVLVLTWSGFVLAQDPPSASASEPLPRAELLDKVLANGVPRRGIERILEFQDRNLGASFVTDIYTCAGAAPDDARACSEKSRVYTTKTVTIQAHDYAVYVDFKRPSRFKRFWFINLKTGDTEMQLVAHGSGSGTGPEPERFSNRRDSRMTSLGIYVAGETYKSKKHGTVLRLHGLERSNSNAYVRDLIFHGAKYASEGYLDRIDKKTKEPVEKIGESWGCPAVEEAFAQKLIPLLKNGGIFFHDHEDLLDQAMAGEEVSLVTQIGRPKK